MLVLVLNMTKSFHVLTRFDKGTIARALGAQHLVHPFGIQTVCSQVLDKVVFVFLKIIQCLYFTTHANIAIIVVQSLLFDMLRLAGNQFMSLVQVLGCLFQSHGHDMPVYLQVIVSCTDSALSKYHLYALRDCSRSLIFEFVIDGQSKFSL